MALAAVEVAAFELVDGISPVEAPLAALDADKVCAKGLEVDELDVGCTTLEGMPPEDPTRFAVLELSTLVALSLDVGTDASPVEVLVVEMPSPLVG